jgi:hypothetical protein
MCVMSDIPTLVVREEGVSGGALDPLLAADHLYGTTLGGGDDDSVVPRWAEDIDTLRADLPRWGDRSDRSLSGSVGPRKRGRDRASGDHHVPHPR